MAKEDRRRVIQEFLDLGSDAVTELEKIEALGNIARSTDRLTAIRKELSQERELLRPIYEQMDRSAAKHLHDATKDMVEAASRLLIRVEDYGSVMKQETLEVDLRDTIAIFHDRMRRIGILIGRH